MGLFSKGFFCFTCLYPVALVTVILGCVLMCEFFRTGAKVMKLRRSFTLAALVTVTFAYAMSAMDMSPVVRVPSEGRSYFVDNVDDGQVRRERAMPDAAPPHYVAGTIHSLCPFEKCPCVEYCRGENHCAELCYKCCCAPCMLCSLGENEVAGCSSRSVSPTQEPVCCGCSQSVSLFWRMICCWPCIAIGGCCGCKQGGG